MRKKLIIYCTTVIGLILLAVGLYLVKAVPEALENMKALPFIFIGLGTGILGNGIGDIISRRALKGNPAFQKQIETDQKDERNVAISYRAKAKAYDMMIFVYSALLLAFALMGINRTAILMLVCAYLFVVFYSIYYRHKYEKEM